ncbi:PUCC protein [Chloroherpeton thalassium ATCC 35110]|uniref:PUCC protein n=1 Tax=Chloroherpeton thalassium (strain ATCC 35110 / GB-78) TaxID=517418 RepID=B3QX42_CHLT3|nr:BCD family MFS transporter [Chloroherpeton thalassium]ACF14852.1 PUCC protein [Chloroherpeton thalassium ATCC 35110]
MKKALYYVNLVRLSLFQMGFGIMLGFLHDTLNRVMTSDLGISSTIVFGLISLKELLAVFGVKVWAGNLSDRTSIMGFRRTPFILLGLFACVVSFVLAPEIAYQVTVKNAGFPDIIFKALSDFALLKLVLIFMTFGFGLQVATTTYYALIADYVGDKNIGKVTSTSWTLMVLTTIVSARVVGSYLDEYSVDRLTNVAQIGGLIGLTLSLVAVIGVEKRFSDAMKKTEEAVLSFKQSLQLLTTSPNTLLFAFYIFLSIFALFANEIVMEPFGADVFGMPVGQTTKLFRPTMGGMQLIFMLIVGFMMNKIGSKRAIYIGNTFCTIGFGLVIFSGMMLDETMLRIALVIVGIGLGASSISNITMMMTMTAGRSGIYIGLWGTAQSLAMFLGHFGAGIVRDVVMSFTGEYMSAYTVIFGMEMLAFTTATIVLPKISKQDFESESKVKIEELLAASGVD